MPNDIQITYINNSLNKDLPKIFLFAQNELPTFNALYDGVAWKVIKDIGRGSMCTFNYPSKTDIYATWSHGENQTNELNCQVGIRYTVMKNATGIVLRENGKAIHPTDIELTNEINTPNGISAILSKSNSKIVSKDIVAYRQKATFRLFPKLYWGIASEINQSDSLFSAVLDSDQFFEQNLENVSSVTVSLNGNAEDGYSFKIENQE